jgi:hypothetical protein
LSGAPNKKASLRKTTKSMFIRETKRKSNASVQYSVVENYRENGKVKQRIIVYIGSLPVGASEAWTKPFWKKANARLEDLPDAEKVKLKAKLKEKLS